MNVFAPLALSPQQDLTPAQQALVERIVTFCRGHLSGARGVFVVEGDAGTGKSLVMNTAFDRIQTIARGKDGQDALRNTKNLFVVNHPEMIKFYRRVAETLPCLRKADYARPTTFINSFRKTGKTADVVFVDEAHLLLTRADRYNHFAQDNHLQEILALARVVVLVFDPHQVLKFKSYWDRAALDGLLHGCDVEHVHLTDQFRMRAKADVTAWIHAFRECRLLPLPARQAFDFRIFDDAQTMYDAIRAHDRQYGLCRMLSTYDYPYTLDGADHFITEGRFHLRWDRSLPEERLPWAERPDTIDEVGSVYTVQGFDLNYAGVILGPSILWDDASQRIIIDTDRYEDRSAFAGRQGIAQPERIRREIMLNAINVLMTRPMHGLYLYASNPALRAKLAALRDHAKGPAS
ncbi:DUF2075 domain-containing protein [Brytella acorum]|uniref:DUF2075 domain-containing protein n=1 Tax=Brytella acorum TaxID=2959299 RepID=A0AA35UH65_9PROT|nr:DUF2075 domain-containing protein [Brytella acorum]MDF3625818.1 DUF2075 domain-containing protein [Brytella acorum]CAI9121246.1 DUF2075 domain-containing protein [Brytella acorum]